MDVMNKNPFSFFDKGENEIDKLFSILKDYGFEPINPKYKGDWHEYDLPCIEITDVEPTNKDKCFDGYLGIYCSRDANWEREGRIVLFRKNIYKESIRYAMEFNLEKNICYINLTKIVLFHEIGHWIFHYVKTKNSIYNSHLIEINDNLSEPIAQYITETSIGNNVSLKKMFDWLNDNSNKIYTIPDSFPKSLLFLSIYRDIIESHQLFPKTIAEYNMDFFNKNRGRILSNKLGL